jgi:integrase/recombinase XerD
MHSQSSAVAVLNGQAPATQTDADAIAAAWLLGYRGATRDAYRRDLADWAAWLDRNNVHAFDARRVHVDAYVRELETLGRTSSTIARRLTALAGFYGYAVDEGALAKSPVQRVKRPKTGNASQATGLDSTELAAFLAAARTSSARDHALACLLALNGLRISEALGATVDDLGHERGHRTLTISRKGGAASIVPLAPRTNEAISAMLAGREEGPLFATSSGRSMDRHAAQKVVRRLARQAKVDKRISPHSLRHAFVTAALDAGVSLRDVQDAAGHADPRTTRRYDRARYSLDRHPTYTVANRIGD